jgi:hypothetical protein
MRQTTPRKLFVSSLSHNVTYRMLKLYVNSRIGPNYSLTKSKNKGKNKFCYAIIEVYTKEDYQELLEKPFVLRGKLSQVREWLDESQRRSKLNDKITRRVYFWNSEFQKSSLDEKDLEYAFRCYGAVEEVFIKRMKL